MKLLISCDPIALISCPAPRVSGTRLAYVAAAMVTAIRAFRAMVMLAGE